jgi:hypothetical protein
MPTSPKNTFLAVYDYGQGGVWVLIDAESPEKIESRFPDLKVVKDRPHWMSDEIMNGIERSRHFDIDAPVDWLLNLRASP